MAAAVRKVQYFYATVRGEPDEAYSVLDNLAGQGVNLLALNTMPLGPESIQFTLFADDATRLQEVARSAGWALEGPHSALLVQGDDEMGAIAKLHAKLHKAGVHVYASSAVVDGRGGFGYVMYLRHGDADRAVVALAG